MNEAFLVVLTIFSSVPDYPDAVTVSTPVTTWDSCQVQKAEINKRHMRGEVWVCARCVVNPFQGEKE